MHAHCTHARVPHIQAFVEVLGVAELDIEELDDGILVDTVLVERVENLGTMNPVKLK